MKKVETFLDKVVYWAGKQASVLGISLVGSYARNAARPDSDIDLVILSNKPSKLLANSEWLSEFGKVISKRHGDYGLVQSMHVLYEDIFEVEYGITTLEWTKTNPVDRETYKVVTDGMRILYDPEDYFQRLEEAICDSKEVIKRARRVGWASSNTSNVKNNFLNAHRD